MRQTSTFWPLKEGRLLSTESDQALTSQECQEATLNAVSEQAMPRECSCWGSQIETRLRNAIPFDYVVGESHERVGER